MNGTIDLAPYFGSLLALAGLVTLVTGWLKTHLLKLDGWKAQVLTWVISVALAFVGQWKGLGLFSETDVLWTVLNGLGVGLVANGVYSVEIVQSILAFLKAKKTVK
jgi:hypothetical protein